jgi:hypothetical protein
MSRKLASFRDYDDKLFELYTRCRYNELICAELMSGAVRLEKWNQWMLFGSIVGSLLAGALGFLNAPSFAWAWASFGALATGLSLYSLIVDAGGRRFLWFGLAGKFLATAEEVEQFSLFVQRRKITEQELLSEWRTFSKKLADLVEQGGHALREYEAQHDDRLRDRLAAILKRERRAARQARSR